MVPDEPIPIAEPEGIFQVRKQAGSHAVLWLLGGIGLLAFAILGFLIAQFGRVTQLSFHSMTTLPAILGFGAIFAAWSKFRAPREVGVGPNGVRIETGRESRTYSWDQIGWSTVQAGGMGFQRSLRIYDVKGRMLADISDAIDDFDTLVDTVAKRIKAKDDPTAARIQKSKAKRTAVLAAMFGVAIIAVSGWLAWNTHNEIRAARLLEESAVPGVAQIEKRFIAPNGITPRLVYRVTAPNGQSATQNVEVERRVWDALEGKETVPVLYVPDDPGISRLMIGEVKSRDSFQNPLIGYGLPAAGAALGIFFIGAAVLLSFGWSIDLDSRTGKLSIKRFGSGK